MQNNITFASTSIYADWAVGIDGKSAMGDDVVWDLGTETDYPLLSVDFDRDERGIGYGIWQSSLAARCSL